MDEIATKALLIGISIFVTLIIVTVIIVEFFQISQIYKNVGETNVSFESQFNEFDKFNDSNNIFNGLDVKNYIKKYADDDSVEICVGTNCSDIDLNNINYSDEYSASLEKNVKGYKIVFLLKQN